MNINQVNTAPKTLQVEVTSRCNLKCKMCPLTTGDTLSSHHPNHMENILWQDILPLAKQCAGVTLTGYGEPFLYPEFLPLLQQLNDAKIPIGFSTNGTLLTAEIAQKLSQLEQIVHINFSIDSPEPESYREIRGGDVNKALQGLRHLSSAIGNPGIITISSVLMAQNLKALVQFPALLHELGIHKFYLQGLQNYNESCDDSQLINHRDLFKYLDAIEQQCQAFGIEIIMPLAERLTLEQNSQEAFDAYFSPDFTTPGDSKQCNVPWEIPFIDREGRVFPCCNASKDATAIMGNLHDSPWEQIWNGAAFLNFRQGLLDGGQAVPSICQSCTAAKRGPHPLQSYVAQIVPQLSRLSGTNKLKLVVKNIGTQTWTANDPIYVAPTAPRDRSSRLWHSTWLNNKRAAHFQEAQVSPGELASFEFTTAKAAHPISEQFELVHEGKTWMQNTRFTVVIPRGLRASLDHWLKR